MILDWFAYSLLLLGAFFCLIAAIGNLRFRDLYSRMHAATKAGAFGLTLILLGVNLLVLEWRVAVTSLLVVVFFYVTAPIGAHMIGRAAYRSGIARPENTEPDEYQGSYVPPGK